MKMGGEMLRIGFGNMLDVVYEGVYGVRVQIEVTQWYFLLRLEVGQWCYCV